MNPVNGINSAIVVGSSSRPLKIIPNNKEDAPAAIFIMNELMPKKLPENLYLSFGSLKLPFLIFTSTSSSIISEIIGFGNINDDIKLSTAEHTTNNPTAIRIISVNWNKNKRLEPIEIAPKQVAIMRVFVKPL
jgi:hypothetical protein